MKKQLIRICAMVISLIPVTVFAQPAIPIKGMVKEAGSGKPLVNAVVKLISYKQSSTTQKTIITSVSGNFEFKVDPGRYVILVSHTGFGDNKKDINTMNLPSTLEFSLKPVAASLAGVTVTAHKPLIEQNDDKIIYNVESDPAAKAETAIDILRKTPFISVDGDNNVQLNGQSNYKILLNGRETAMFAQNAKEALKGFPGALIVKIEVITSPSAKYDAEGVGGIINIVTKKKVAGYNGSIGTQYNTNNNYGINSNLSVKAGKLGVAGYYNFNGAENVPGISTLETTPKSTFVFSKRTIDGSRLMNYAFRFGNLEASLDLDSLNTITAYGNTSGGRNKIALDQLITTNYTFKPAETGSYIQDGQNEYPTTGIGLDFVRKYKSSPEKEFSIRLNGLYSSFNSLNNSVQDNASVDRFVISNSETSNKEYTIQSDYILPLKNKTKLETGAKVILRNASADFSSFLKYNMADTYKNDPANTNNFNYRQQIYSAYTSYNFQLKTYSFRVGARVERTELSGNFVSSGTLVDQRYTNFIPNLQVSHRFGKKLTTVLNYNMRLQRPAISSLNPFIVNNDSLNISYGNPKLGPQIGHFVAIQNKFFAGKTFIGLTFIGALMNNLIVQVADFNNTTGVTSFTSFNIGREVQVGCGVNITAPLSSKTKLSLNGGIRYNHVSNVSNASQTGGGMSGSGSMNVSYRATTKFTIVGSAYYFQVPGTLVSKIGANYGHTMSFSYRLFNEKVTASIAASNIYQRYFSFTNTTETESFRTVSISKNPYRAITFGLTWNFGKLKENVSKKKGIVNDDLISGQAAQGNS